MLKVIPPIPQSVRVMDVFGVQWIDVAAQGDEEIQWLKQTFGFRDLDLREVVQNPQRTQFSSAEDYFFLAISFPLADVEHQRISGREIDVFLGKDYVLTVHDNTLPFLREAAHEVSTLQATLPDAVRPTPAYILYRILKRAYVSTLRATDVFSANIHDIEKKLFTSPEQVILRDILVVKQNLSEMRYVVQGHKNTLRKLIASSPLLWDDAMISVYYQHLVEDVKEIWDTLDNLNHAVGAMYETHTSLQSAALNRTMQLLTLIYVSLSPAALIVGFFGMKVINPGWMQQFTFWDVLGLVTAVEVTLLLFFKWKKIL